MNRETTDFRFIEGNSYEGLVEGCNGKTAHLTIFDGTGRESEIDVPTAELTAAGIGADQPYLMARYGRGAFSFTAYPLGLAL